MNSRYPEYDNYLYNHINNVMRAWKEILRPVLIKSDIEKQIIHSADYAISNHDASKTSVEEYEPYLNYFYPESLSDPDEIKFNQAWLHHIHNNKHHWQYWILIMDDIDSNDSHKYVPQDMDEVSIIEMLCDWHSFSAVYSESTAYNFYNAMRNRIMISDNTRNEVERLLEYMKTPLSAN